MKFCELTKFCYFLLIGLLEENRNACRDKNKQSIHFSTNMTLNIGIPVMRYDRAARPCALNFRIAALKCRFGRPPNALSSVGCMTFYAPTLCLFYPKRNNTNRTPIYRKKNVAYPNTVTCLLSQIVPVNKQIKSNQQLMTLLIVYILDDTCEITCTRSRCSRHYLRSNNYRKNVLR